jgi:hypothetical protein
MIEIKNVSEDEYIQLARFTEKLRAATDLVSDVDNMLIKTNLILANAKGGNDSAIKVPVFDLNKLVDRECIEDIRDAFKALRGRRVSELDSMRLSTGQEP